MNVHLSNRDNAARLSIIENVIAYGFSPPRHVHHSENESFYVLEGEFRFECDGREIIARSGDLVHAPAGLMHSFVVLSPEGGRMLTISDGAFEDMVREVSRPALGDGLPEQVVPDAAEQRMLAEACLRNGIELIGAPLHA